MAKSPETSMSDRRKPCGSSVLLPQKCAIAWRACVPAEDSMPGSTRSASSQSCSDSACTSPSPMPSRQAQMASCTSCTAGGRPSLDPVDVVLVTALALHSPSRCRPPRRSFCLVGCEGSSDERRSAPISAGPSRQVMGREAEGAEGLHARLNGVILTRGDPRPCKRRPGNSSESRVPRPREGFPCADALGALGKPTFVSLRDRCPLRPRREGRAALGSPPSCRAPSSSLSGVRTGAALVAGLRHLPAP